MSGTRSIPRSVVNGDACGGNPLAARARLAVMARCVDVSRVRASPCSPTEVVGGSNTMPDVHERSRGASKGATRERVASESGLMSGATLARGTPELKSPGAIAGSSRPSMARVAHLGVDGERWELRVQSAGIVITPYALMDGGKVRRRLRFNLDLLVL